MTSEVLHLQSVIDNGQPGGICITTGTHTKHVKSNTFLRILIECKDVVDMMHWINKNFLLWFHLCVPFAIAPWASPHTLVSCFCMQSASRADDSALCQTVSHAALQLCVNRGLIGASFARMQRQDRENAASCHCRRMYKVSVLQTGSSFRRTRVRRVCMRRVPERWRAWPLARILKKH